MLRALCKATMVGLALLCWTLPALAGDVLPVMVSIAPQRYFVEQIGKQHVAVEVLVPPGLDPHTYEPKPGQMAALAKAKIYFAVGVPFEKAWLPKFSAANPLMRVVHTDQGIVKIPMVDHDHLEKPRAGEVQEHDSDGFDPHIWLSPPLVKLQAQSILNALQAIDPDHGDEYAANGRRFMAEIDQLDADLRSIFAGKTGLRFMVFHPAWGYFAQAYGLEQVPIEMAGKEPKPAQLEALIIRAKQRGIQVVFAQPQYSAKSAQIVAQEIHGQVVLADPMAADWASNLRAVAEKFKAALK
ncbi:MAG: zinc ABC transporter substrate-binding protein [Desulfobacteraceae bacterium]|nr:zinc ABC transporter substrate-binding protein [Desulfobacteraceae bacterium]